MGHIHIFSVIDHCGEVVEREEGGEEEGEGREKKGKSRLDFPPTCFVCLFFVFSGRVYIK